MPDETKQSELIERGRFEGEVLTRLASIERVLAELKDLRTSDRQETDNRFGRLEKRIATLEQWRFWMLGAMSIIVIFVNMAWSYIQKLIK